MNTLRVIIPAGAVMKAEDIVALIERILESTKAGDKIEVSTK
jgi:hypothetical protein